METGGGGELSRRSGTEGIEIEIDDSLAAAAGVVGEWERRKGKGKSSGSWLSTGGEGASGLLVVTTFFFGRSTPAN